MKITYITSHGTAEWVATSKTDDSILHIQFTPECNGAITLGGIAYEVKHGSVDIPLGALQNGEYRPKLEADTGVFIAEGFCKSGHDVSMLPTEQAVVRRLVSRCYTLEKMCDALDKKVSHLETLCQGHRIFDFERMENEKQA